MNIREIQASLRKMSNSEDLDVAARFIKTGKGEYGENDLFLGIRVPALRLYAKECKDLPLNGIIQLISSRYHEERLFALLLLVQLFKKSEEPQRSTIYRAYLDNTRYINGWDLVDSSAYHIVGPHLANRKRDQLLELAKSQSLWERRIAIVATLHFIRLNQFSDTLKVARILLDDKEDLIHKAVGWMLREVGNRDLPCELEFLDKHYKVMPRTMLRYAIEKFAQADRHSYLTGTR